MRVYVDSSVWNGAFDDHAPELQAHTLAFFDSARSQTHAELYFSDVVIEELAKAPGERASLLVEFLRVCNPQRLALDVEADDLARAYISYGVLSGNHVADARHVAIASVAELNVLVSWNYRHLVNRRRREAFNGVNAIRGYRPIEIVSPPEVFDA